MALSEQERTVLIDVLVYHWRHPNSGCGCGWGSEPSQLGASWPAHIVEVYEASLEARE